MASVSSAPSAGLVQPGLQQQQPPQARRRLRRHHNLRPAALRQQQAQHPRQRRRWSEHHRAVAMVGAARAAASSSAPLAEPPSNVGMAATDTQLLLRLSELLVTPSGEPLLDWAGGGASVGAHVLQSVTFPSHGPEVGRQGGAKLDGHTISSRPRERGEERRAPHDDHHQHHHQHGQQGAPQTPPSTHNHHNHQQQQQQAPRPPRREDDDEEEGDKPTVQGAASGKEDHEEQSRGAARVVGGDKAAAEAEEQAEFRCNVGRAILTLQEDLPLALVRKPDFSIFREDVALVLDWWPRGASDYGEYFFPTGGAASSEPLSGRDPAPRRVTLHGLDKYRLVFWTLRTQGQAIFGPQARVRILRIWQPWESKQRVINVRWCFDGCTRLLDLPTTVDGVSEYKLDKHGMIYEHRVVNLIMNDTFSPHPASFRGQASKQRIPLTPC